MMKLAANSEFREAAQKVVSELQKAGVDITSQVRKLFSEVYTFADSLLPGYDTGANGPIQEGWRELKWAIVA
jgi:hypothetical protein